MVGEGGEDEGGRGGRRKGVECLEGRGERGWWCEHSGLLALDSPGEHGMAVDRSLEDVCTGGIPVVPDDGFCVLVL